MDDVIIITGTRKGIGKYLAQYYLEKGNTVCGCSRGESSIVNSRYVHFCADVSDENTVRQMVFTIFKKYGRIDVLINNAGIASMNHFMLMPLKSIKTIFATNVFGTFLFVRECAKYMMKKKAGRIINFATVATPLKLEGESVYAASKASVESFTRIMAREVAPFGITVNACGPTPVQTDLVKNVPKLKMKALIERQAIQRYGTFEDVSNVCDFFINPRSNFITGQIIYLGGIS